MRTAYVLFTLIILSISGYSLSGSARGGILSERTLRNYPAFISESPPETLLKQTIELFVSPLFEPYEAGIKAVPRGNKKNQLPQHQNFNDQDFSSEEEDYDQESQEAVPFFRDVHFEKLSGRLNTTLNKLDNWLKSHPDIVLILELDIDGVMIHFLPPPTLDNLSDSPENQQKILDRLDAFIREHPNIYLFYNTARSDLSFERPHRTIQAEADGPYGNNITYQLPAARAIITGGGGHIELASDDFATVPDLIEINAALDQWREDDLKALPNVLSSFVISNHYHSSGSKTRLPIILTRKNSGSPLITGPFNTLPMMQFIALFYKTTNDILYYSFNGVALNKGTAARLLLSLLLKKQFLKGKKGLLIAAGDSFYDAPMINPVFEAATLEVVNENQLTTMENRIRNDIRLTKVPQLPPATNFYWKATWSGCWGLRFAT